MSIVFENEDGQALKTWVNAEDMGGCPMMGDHVILHWGDDDSVEEGEYEVIYRIIDGMVSDRIRCIVREVTLLT